ncbi:MAG: anaerobic ribonucleoside-triphosphate reductase activating protein [Paludibacteraceae bacterium]|nr:anaerobic ribonucleoside-triphosphate reductase activating protein [Paludibacteraceae bacterium]
MLKYTDAEIVFEEIPDEVTLAINISNCPHHCIGCHSPYLRDDIGEPLYGDTLVNLVEKNKGVTCILFMGEGKDEEHLFHLIELIRHLWRKNMKIGLYTGANNVSPYLWENLDYVKTGPYIDEYGPLNKRTTNQRFYKRFPNEGWKEITSVFWRD